MGVPVLTASTVLYLFATDWLPCDEREHTVAVPGGSCTALATAGNLLHVALWDLRRQGLIGLRQLRPVERERIVVLGGRSFAGFDLLGPTAVLDGLEGALLRAASQAEDDNGLRRLVALLDLHDRAPWTSVTGHCFGEAAAAGLVEARGRLIRKVEIADPAGVESLRERCAELRALRAADMDREPDLHHAVIADCLQAVDWAHNTPT